MKKINQNPMSAWKPRRPSAGLRQRIFAARPAAPEHHYLWNLLVPAAACVMLTLLVMKSNNPVAYGRHLAGGLSLSNLDYPAFGEGGSENAQNHLDYVNFAWTNRGSLSSLIGFTSSTN